MLFGCLRTRRRVTTSGFTHSNSTLAHGYTDVPIREVSPVTRGAMVRGSRSRERPVQVESHSWVLTWSLFSPVMSARISLE